VFLVSYAAVRIPIDLLREYPREFLGLGAGQTNNILMLTAGLLLLGLNWWRSRSVREERAPAVAGTERPATGLRWRRWVLAGLLLAALAIPSDAPRDVPEAYGTRHPGLVHSVWYPPLNMGQ
jgi:hypothetical protein